MIALSFFAQKLSLCQGYEPLAAERVEFQLPKLIAAVCDLLSVLSFALIKSITIKNIFIQRNVKLPNFYKMVLDESDIYNLKYTKV